MDTVLNFIARFGLHSINLMSVGEHTIPLIQASGIKYESFSNNDASFIYFFKLYGLVTTTKHGGINEFR
jgi:hypothetical protein